MQVLTIPVSLDISPLLHPVLSYHVLSNAVIGVPQHLLESYLQCSIFGVKILLEARKIDRQVPQRTKRIAERL